MNSISELQVELAERSYPIYVGVDVLKQPNLIAPHLCSNQIFIVTNTTISPLYFASVVSLVMAARPEAQVSSIELPDGEQYKTLDTVSTIFDALLAAGCNRKATIIALGGGVVGDMAGFAAACYQRGVPFIQIPTTVLSQVDSSVGGKTGVNHPSGKNMIGAFYQPQLVLIDIGVLSSLPARELSAGLAEIIKYGLISDAAFFYWLEDNIDALKQRDPEALIYAIRRSCEIKASVVAQDEFEGGVRAILNLGHTYGHAIETEMGYGQWLHGEAVAVGMIMACELSVSLGWVDESVLSRTISLIKKADLPIVPPKSMGAEAFIKHMKVDKKVLDGRIRLVLLTKLGEAVVSSDFDGQVFDSQLSAL